MRNISNTAKLPTKKMRQGIVLEMRIEIIFDKF